MKWRGVDSIEEIIHLSEHKPVLLFKHSTRCGISGSALNRLERNWKPADDEKAERVMVSVLTEKDLSSQIASCFNIPHESPQVIVVKNGKSVYHVSHYDIRYEDLMGKF